MFGQTKQKKKPGPKKKTKAQFCKEKRKSLAESNKGSWFNQPSLEQVLEGEDNVRRCKVRRVVH